MNPFNNQPLTFEELQNDCLCFLHYQRKPVKASRLFAGNEHEMQTKRLADHFGVSVDAYKEVGYNKDIIKQLRGTQFNREPIVNQNNIVKQFIFENRNLNDFTNYEIAYHQLLLDIVNQQISSTNLVIHNSPVKKVFVDGGFSKNPIFMNLLAEAFPKMEVYAASMAQASALGAALAIHKSWNSKPIQNDLIDLKFYKH
jgi:hypothetical protein